MSRIGNSPILIPEGVNVQISPDEVIVSGKLGTLNQSYDCVSVEQKENEIIVSRDKDLIRRTSNARLLGVENDTEARFNRNRSWLFDVKHRGFRYHMSDIMAAIGRAQLKKIDQFPTRKYFSDFDYDKNKIGDTCQHWINAQKKINNNTELKFFKTQNILAHNILHN